jgi:hypothetical protein
MTYFLWGNVYWTCEFKISEEWKKFRREIYVNICEEEHMFARNEPAGLVKYSHAKENDASNKSVELDEL